MGSKQSKADKAARKAAKAAGRPAPKKLTKKERKRKAKEDAARQKAEADTAAEDARLRALAQAHRKERRELAKTLGQGISDHKLYEALQASLAKTTWETGNPRAPRCVPTGADDPGEGNPPIGCLGDCTPLPAPTRRAAACCA